VSDTGPTSPEQPEPAAEPPRSVLDPPTVLTPPAPTTGLDAVGAGSPARRPMRLRTVVFGLVLLTVSVLTLLGSVAGIRLSVPMVAVVILVGAGFVLVAGGLSAALRESAGRAHH
jgi:hypothetical protein